MEESWSSGGAPLLRTRSLPLVLEASGPAPTRQARLDPRQLLTLTRHYYPEGGWGWGVALAATLVQMLSHGLHQASAILAVEAVRRFGPDVRMQAARFTTVQVQSLVRQASCTWTVNTKGDNHVVVSVDNNK
ncbi:Uncharacterized protein OBRU01_01227 [Operophtera brumata]|uniref:Uncharacterized protein n=1 Tax=Operophtera brumata TaxID=104452 RepID=A0A0L7LUI3_OPEBR|nr:Uncharacterized protein OBRU01_01227 [Operophtera brumata]